MAILSPMLRKPRSKTSRLQPSWKLFMKKKKEIQKKKKRILKVSWPQGTWKFPD